MFEDLLRITIELIRRTVNGAAGIWYRQMWEVTLHSTEWVAESHEKTTGTDVGSLVFDENMWNKLRLTSARIIIRFSRKQFE